MRIKDKKSVFCSAALCLSLAFAGTHAQAAPLTILELSNGATTVTISDGDVSDKDARTGVILINEVVGDFDLNLTVGLSMPNVGSATSPIMHLNSINASSSAIGTLVVKLTTTGFTGPTPAGLGTLATGGTTNGFVGSAAFVDAGNAPFAESTPVASVGVFSGGAFSGTDASVVPLSGTYSATIVTTITHNDPTDVTNVSSSFTIVPEPSSAILVGLGLAGLAARRRRD